MLMDVGGGYESPCFSLYTGMEGVKRVMEDVIGAGGELLFICDIARGLDSSLGEYFDEHFRCRFDLGIDKRGIIGGGYEGYEYICNGIDKILNVGVRFDSDINIYDDKIAFISYMDEVACIIEDAHIANAQAKIFNMLFTLADSAGQ